MGRYVRSRQITVHLALRARIVLLAADGFQNKQIHLIVDQYSIHKHAAVKRRLQRHKRFHVHFTPASA